MDSHQLFPWHYCTHVIIALLWLQHLYLPKPHFSMTQDQDLSCLEKSNGLSQAEKENYFSKNTDSAMFGLSARQWVILIPACQTLDVLEHKKHLKILLKCRFWFCWSKMSLELCISCELPCDADATGTWSMLWVPRLAHWVVPNWASRWIPRPNV